MKWRDLTDEELAVVELLMTDAKFARESALPVVAFYDEPVKIMETAYGWLRGVRDTGRIQIS